MPREASPIPTLGSRAEPRLGARSEPLTAFSGLEWRRVLPAVGAGSALLVVLIGLAWSSGGYFASGYLAAGAGAFAVIGALLPLFPLPFGLSLQASLALAALLGLTAWMGLSTTWSSAAEVGLENTQRSLLYIGIFGLGLLTAGSGRYARQTVWLVFGVLGVIAGAGLISRFYPDLLGASAPIDRLVYRLSYPLSYWNAFGAVAAMGIVLGTGLAADSRSPRVLRGLAAAVVVLLIEAMYLSLSRGAWLSMAVGLLVLLTLTKNRGSLLITSAIVAVGGGLAVIAVARHHVLVDVPGSVAAQTRAGHDFVPQLVLLSITAGGVQYVLAHVGSRLDWHELRRVARPAVRGIAIAIVFSGVLGYLAAGSRVEGRSANVLDSSSHFVSRQWHDFMTPAAPIEGTGNERLFTARGTRSEVYRIAIAGFRAHPLIGDGSGGFEPRYFLMRRDYESAKNAHSLYLETAQELGLVGFLALLAFLGALVWAAVLAIRRPATMPRSQAAAVCAGCSVWLVHAGVDWDWQMPALTGAFLVLATTLLPVGRKRRSSRRRSGVTPSRSQRPA